MTDNQTNTTTGPVTWWQHSLGQCVLQKEKTLFQLMLPYFHGYCQLQIGVEERLLPKFASPKMQVVMSEHADVSGSNQALPFKCHSIDTVLMIHTLEYAEDPHQTLREAERILVGDGTLIIASFNPWSVWGLRRLFSRKRHPPWAGHFFSQTRITDWLSLLNFDVVETKHLVFRPPLNSEKWFRRTQKLETLGQRFWPFFSGVNILVATKRTIPLTPVTQRWQTRQFFPTGRLVTKPVAREKIHD